MHIGKLAFHLEAYWETNITFWMHIEL